MSGDRDVEYLLSWLCRLGGHRRPQGEHRVRALGAIASTGAARPVDVATARVLSMAGPVHPTLRAGQVLHRWLRGHGARFVRPGRPAADIDEIVDRHLGVVSRTRGAYLLKRRRLLVCAVADAAHLIGLVRGRVSDADVADLVEMSATLRGVEVFDSERAGLTLAVREVCAG